ncbi:hypothetical protein WDD9_005391 [Paenibacillus melissococcoides]|nr:hypothetical protein HTL2_005182 [Paenibacillus melissococcoides]CAH8718961.1 hypothetical protein WDD9_005391 [Paenibacillus melissococcoides]
MPCITLLPYYSDAVARGLGLEELLIYLDGKVKADTFLMHEESNLEVIRDKHERAMLIAREVKVRERLKINGHQYPRNVGDVVQLYLDLGLALVSTDETNGQLRYDLIIRPLSHVDTVLKSNL